MTLPKPAQHNPLQQPSLQGKAAIAGSMRDCQSHKRLIVCCDGTWNEPSESPIQQDPTNVFKIAQAIPDVDRHGVRQLVGYFRGLGTGGGMSRLTAGAIGAGIDQAIQDAYLFLSMNYRPGDEIYLFGFSRGAYTVRSLAGFIYVAGLLQPEKMRCEAGVPSIDRIRLANRLEEAYQLYRSPGVKPSSEQAIAFREQDNGNFGQVPIQLLCCWDTVSALGLPDLLPGVRLNEAFNRRYRFHDYKLCAKIKYALHAVALDELRPSFDVTPMEVPANQDSHLEQMLFPGNHGCVGGGTKATGLLANGALQWVLDRIDAIPELDLEIDINKLGEPIGDDGKLVTDPLQPIAKPESLKTRLLWASLGVFAWGFKRHIPALSEAAIAWLAQQSNQPLSPLKQRQLARQQRLQSLNHPQSSATYDLHESAKARLLAADYEPESLGEYLQEVLAEEGDRVFQALKDKVAATI